MLADPTGRHSARRYRRYGRRISSNRPTNSNLHSGKSLNPNGHLLQSDQPSQFGHTNCGGQQTTGGRHSNGGKADFHREILFYLQRLQTNFHQNYSLPKNCYNKAYSTHCHVRAFQRHMPHSFLTSLPTYYLLFSTKLPLPCCPLGLTFSMGQ
jgi:hypothetical protein